MRCFLFLIMLLIPVITISQEQINDTLQVVNTEDNPGLETLNTWSLATPSEEKVRRIHEERERHEKQMLYNDIEEILLIVVPIILLILGIIFIRKIIKN